MIGFESYQVQAWRDGVLTIRTDPATAATRKAPKRKQNWKVSIASSALSVGIAMMTVLVPTGNALEPVQKHRASEHSAVLGGVVVSPSYWADMVTQLRNAPKLSSQSLENDPDPIV